MSIRLYRLGIYACKIKVYAFSSPVLGLTNLYFITNTNLAYNNNDEKKWFVKLKYV